MSVSSCVCVWQSGGSEFVSTVLYSFLCVPAATRRTDRLVDSGSSLDKNLKRATNVSFVVFTKFVPSVCVLGHRTFGERRNNKPEVVLAPHPRRINRPLPTLPMRAAVGVVIVKPKSFLCVETSERSRGWVLSFVCFFRPEYDQKPIKCVLVPSVCNGATAKDVSLCPNYRGAGKTRPKISPKSSLSRCRASCNGCKAEGKRSADSSLEVAPVRKWSVQRL